MGQEVDSRITWKGKTSAGKAQLETDHLLFRGDFRLKIPFSEMTKVGASGGRLKISGPQGAVSLELGARADKWADKILNPPSVLDKLGVRPDHKVSILGSAGKDFTKDVEARTGTSVGRRARKDSDLIFLFADDERSATKVEGLRSYLVPNGGIWIVYPKGRKELTENDVIEIGRDTGMKDVKVVRFSDSHTALKFVIPVDQR